MASSSQVARSLAVCVLLAACVTADPKPTITPVPPAASPNTTVTPTVNVTDAPPLGGAWQAASGLGDAEIFDVTPGSTGWVAVGTTCDDCAAGAWFSADGIEWSGGAVPNGDVGSSWISSVATDESSWIAAGGRLEPGGGSAAVARALVWRSDEAQTWSLADTIRLGPCRAGCPSVGVVAAGANGAVLSWVQTINPERSSVYWSPDGRDWIPVDRAALGQDPGAGSYMYPTAALVLDDGRFVVVAAVAVWTSPDGRNWSQHASLTPNPTWLDAATDGRRVLVVEQGCEDCATDVWTSADGRTGWQRAPTALPIDSAHVTYAGDMFVLAGTMSGRGLRIFTSRDGMAWTEIDHDLSLRNCRVSDLAGSSDRVVLAAWDHCKPAIWVSRVS